MDEINKTIYFTYKKNCPDKVFNRWKELNKDYEIDFSLDSDCISFLIENFNYYIADLFKKIPHGPYKSDLWRLCKLYIHGGVYADVDLIPYINLDTLDKDVTFYSSLAIDHRSIFQAFIVSLKPKNPLFLIFLLSYLLNNPYTYQNGPTHDMFNCLKNIMNVEYINCDVKYHIEQLKIIIPFGSSNTDTLMKDLHYFPSDVECEFKLSPANFIDNFTFKIVNNTLIVNRIDVNKHGGGWDYNHSVELIIKSPQSIYLFREILPSDNIKDCFVLKNNKKILDSRDIDYYNNKGWN
jgi:hypothetical protein